MTAAATLLIAVAMAGFGLAIARAAGGRTEQAPLAAACALVLLRGRLRDLLALAVPAFVGVAVWRSYLMLQAIGTPPARCWVSRAARCSLRSRSSF